MVISFAEAKTIVRAAEESTWTQGTYQIEDEGFEDATHYLVVRGAAELEETLDPNLVIIPGLVPLVSKATGEIEYVVAHTEWDRLYAMTHSARLEPWLTVRLVPIRCIGSAEYRAPRHAAQAKS